MMGGAGADFERIYAWAFRATYTTYVLYSVYAESKNLIKHLMLLTLKNYRLLVNTRNICMNLLIISFHFS